MVEIAEKERADKVLTLVIAAMAYVHWNAEHRTVEYGATDAPPRACFTAAFRLTQRNLHLMDLTL